MVTAGVYMIARTHFLFDRSPFALSVVAIVGAATAFFAATIGLVQTDIKRVLAYSTISQLGYMFLGCGVAAYSAAIFHLMTHAFFKALLFLAAGSVIHAHGRRAGHAQDGRPAQEDPGHVLDDDRGRPRHRRIPPFAGFFSKDAILYAAFMQGAVGKVLLVRRPGHCAAHCVLYVPALVPDVLGRVAQSTMLHPHESPWSMLGPLVILAVLSVGGGWIGIGALRRISRARPSARTRPKPAARSLELILSVLAVAGRADRLVHRRPALSQQPERPTRLAARSRRLQAARQQVLRRRDLRLRHRQAAARLLEVSCSRWVVDIAILGGLAWLLGGIATLCGAILQRWQSGNLRSYAAWLARRGSAAAVCAGAVDSVLADIWHSPRHGGALRDEAMNNSILTLILLVPLAGAVLVALLPDRGKLPPGLRCSPRSSPSASRCILPAHFDRRPARLPV